DLQFAVDPGPRRFAGNEVQVRAVADHDLLQVLVDLVQEVPTSNFGSTDVSVTNRWNRDLSLAKRKASSGSICFFWIASSSAWSIICMPRSLPVCNWAGIWWVWSVMMSLAMARVIIMISTTAL